MNMNLCILIVCLLLQSALIHSGTPIEDKLETEIDIRPPSHFIQNYSSTILSVRQLPFDKLYVNNSGSISAHNVNSGAFVINYWYETHQPGALCPSTPIGIATHCDWALMIPCLFTDNPYQSPRTIFVHTPMLPHFVESTLKFMDHSYRFILLSGGTDATVPRAWFGDRALRGFNGDMGSYWGQLLNDPRLIHWFCENHDMNHPKLTTLPCGFVSNGRTSVDDFSDHPPRSSIVDITKRKLKFIVSDKVRSGTGIWSDRQYAIDKCIEHKQFCYFPQQNYSRDTGLTHHDFVHLMAKYPFTACVHGSGIEPSPKAWEAVLIGSIPIIQHSTLDDAYERLPAVFVHEWKELFENPDIESLLKGWLEKLAPYYEEGSILRKRTLERLNMKYWLDQIEHKYQHYIESQIMDVHHHNRNITTKTFHSKDTPATSRKLMDIDGLPRRLAIESYE